MARTRVNLLNVSHIPKELSKAKASSSIQIPTGNFLLLHQSLLKKSLPLHRCVKILIQCFPTYYLIIESNMHLNQSHILFSHIPATELFL